LIGKTVSHYQITGQLGAGGMGVVYEALDTKLNRTIALKFLPPESTDNPEAKKRFIQEAQAASALDHPNICTIYEISEFEGRMFIAMARYDGEPLKDRIDRGSLAGEEIVEITRQIAEGMDRAHENGIVHRDLKPANIIITSDGTVKIVDFGLAMSTGATRLTKTGSSMGTLAYMSPEQVGGEEVTHSTDIWALGVMIYEMMEGRAPFEADFEAGIVYGIAHRDPDPPVLQDSKGDHELLQKGLRAICGKALEKNPADRYSGLAEMLADLRALGTNTLEMSGGAFMRPAARARRRGFMAMAAVLAVVVLWAGWQYYSGSDQAVPTIAVLPLQNISDDEEQDFYADGITGELIVKLGRIDGMQVISRTSVMQYRDSDKSLPDIAQELGVDLILEGTILRVDDQVKVTAQLIDAASDKLLWADSYNRDVRDILILQGELAKIIAREVLNELSPEQEALLTETRRIDPEVYDFYMRGKQKLEDISYHEARKYFQQAVALDPSFALGHAGLAVALQFMGHWDGWVRSRTEVNALAKQAARKALELDENLPEAHMAMGMVTYLQDWDWAAADKAFQRAIELDPRMRSRLFIEQYSLFLLRLKRFDECFAVAQRGIDLDPLNKFNHLFMGYLLFYNREWERAEAHFKGMLEKWPDHKWAKRELAWTYGAMGRPDLAVPLFEELGDELNFGVDLLGAWLASGREPEVRALLAEEKINYLSDASVHNAVGIARAHQFLDEPDSAFTWLEKIQDVPVEDSNGNWAYDMAVIYSRLGDQEAALHWLNRAVEFRAPFMLSIQLDWDLDGLLDHPGYEAILRKAGFPES